MRFPIGTVSWLLRLDALDIETVASLDPQRLTPNPGDFERCISDVMPALYSWAYLRVGARLRTHLDPQDVVQEVATRACGSFGTYDATIAPFRAWVFRIAKNYLNETLRSAAVVRHADQSPLTDASGISQLPASATNLSGKIARNDMLRTLLELVDKARPEERELFVRCALQGESCAKAARRMGLSRDAAQKRWLRFREELRGRPWIEELLSSSN